MTGAGEASEAGEDHLGVCGPGCCGGRALFRALGGLGGSLIRAVYPRGRCVTKTADQVFALDELSLLGW